MAAKKKIYYLFYLNQIEFKVLFFLTNNHYFLSLSSWTKIQEALVLRHYYERLKTDKKHVLLADCSIWMWKDFFCRIW